MKYSYMLVFHGLHVPFSPVLKACDWTAALALAHHPTHGGRADDHSHIKCCFKSLHPKS